MNFRFHFRPGWKAPAENCWRASKENQTANSELPLGSQSIKACLVKRAILILVAGAILLPNSFGAQPVHLSVTQPGGMPGVPVVTGIEKTTNGLTITWDGPSGYYQLLRKFALGDNAWQGVGGKTNYCRYATVTNAQTDAFFRVLGPSPKYAGSRVCLECHENIHTSVMDTRHTAAFETLKSVGQNTNPSCLPCHTVGYGLPTGFVNATKTPFLAGVQCESCHGPSAEHAANENDPIVRPRVELASQVCGGCHMGTHQPTFNEWSVSGHAKVVEDMNPANRIESCGRCHSGSARLSMINSKPLPTGDANVPIVCATCHNPHAVTAHPAQLRNPIVSTNDYFLSTAENFSAKYNPEINICAQCHNHRGASWTSTSRAPHHSPQYNFLLGTVGELKAGAAPFRARHATLEKQCVSCHMQSEEYTSPEQPRVTGHTFRVDTFESCQSCHSLPELLVDFTAFATDWRVQQVKSSLDRWATNKAPPELRNKYGVRAWEYTTPGELSTGGSGPTTAEQALIPENIKKARFNMYIVVSDGSGGAHNGPYSVDLLDTAREWVEEELNR